MREEWLGRRHWAPLLKNLELKEIWKLIERVCP
jgi:hypothetical protein